MGCYYTLRLYICDFAFYILLHITTITYYYYLLFLQMTVKMFKNLKILDCSLICTRF